MSIRQADIVVRLEGATSPPGTTASATTHVTSVAALRPRTSFADLQRAPLEVLAIQAADSCLSFGLGRHFHEAKTSGFATELVLNHCRAGDLTESLECCPEIFLGSVMQQIPHVDIHTNLLCGLLWCESMIRYVFKLTINRFGIYSSSILGGNF